MKHEIEGRNFLGTCLTTLLEKGGSFHTCFSIPFRDGMCWTDFHFIKFSPFEKGAAAGVKGSVPSPKQGLKRLVSRTGPSAKLSPSLQPSDSAIRSGHNTSCNKVLPLPTAQIGQQHQQYMSDYCMNGKEVLGDRLSTTYHLPEPSPPDLSCVIPSLKHWDKRSCQSTRAS